MSSAQQIEIPKSEQKSKKSSSSKLDFQIETITPDIAAEYLATSKVREEALAARKFKKGQPKVTGDMRTVSSYANIMKAGGWIMNAMPIIFDTEGRLIDGITRLEACVTSGESFRSVVARNVRSDVLHTIDQHRRRSYTGVLESRGVNYAGSVQRTMTKLIRIENGLLGKDNSNISWSRFDRVLEANPELLEAVSISEGSKGSYLHSTPRPVLSFMALKAGKREELRFFLAGLRDIDTFPLGNPARMLANQLKAEQRKEKMAKENDRQYDKMSIDHVLALAILAFNDFCDKKTVEEEYFWQPDFGKAKKKQHDKKAVMEKAPANLGLPMVNGYPGLEDGSYETGEPADKFTGELADSLIRATKETSGEEQVAEVTITPAKAQEYLKLNRDNRALSDDHKQAIAKDIKQGNWMVNAQPICFTGDPDQPDAKAKGVRLLNGQHRLHGCIEADMPIEVPIAKNIPEEAFATFDAHTKKMRLRTKSEADDRVLAAAARLQWKEDSGIEIFSTGINPTASEIKDTIELHPGMEAAYPKARTLKNVGSAGVMTYLIYHVRNDRPDIAEDFLEALRTGENLQARDPALAARTKIVGIRTAKKNQRIKVPRKEILQTLINSWRDYKEYRDDMAEDTSQQELI
ncbi:hypothetical protein ACGYLO_12675 [Sulfitobacter sp. 1A13353]|uniref:hypothetical protein n=1 Tax=Sulfitobacter sp. 1A13353 TaxID=3368568 RepID=UPI0037465EA5